MKIQDLEVVGQTTQPAIESDEDEKPRNADESVQEHDLSLESEGVGSFQPLPPIQNDYALEIKSFNYYKKPYY